MKRFVLGMTLAALTAPLAACDDDGPTTPSNQPVVFTAPLSALNEVPPVSNTESGGRGTATITFTLTRDSRDAITGGSARFEVSLNSFPANTVMRAAHIHPGATGVNGSPLVDTGLTAASPVTLATGSGSFTLERQLTISPAEIQSIIDNPSGFYFNVHSAVNTGGAARGQLTRQ